MARFIMPEYTDSWEDKRYYYKIALEVQGEAYIPHPKMAEEIAILWRKEWEESRAMGLNFPLSGVRPIPGSINMYESYHIKTQ